MTSKHTNKDKYFYPILVPETNETRGAIINRWDKFDKLTGIEQEKISSKETAKKIAAIGNFFNLTAEQSGAISRLLRKYYFKEISLNDISIALAREIPIDMVKAQEISKMVIEKIINDKSVEQASQAKLLQITIADALQQIPDLGEQLITSEKIVLKNFPEPVRPSLKNWLADYDYLLFNKEHTAMERGIYLFQSANGKRLNSQDRNRLAYVLKAYDEKTPVSVNKEMKQIVFAPSSAPLPSPQPSPYKGEEGSLRFSSAQKLPYEKNVAKPYVVKPVLPQRSAEPQKPLPKNIVNLKEQ